jgi:solute carrier family 25 (mitochondrial carnitine/acylcarnitine transporter), member 20/29
MAAESIHYILPRVKGYSSSCGVDSKVVDTGTPASKRVFIKLRSRRENEGWTIVKSYTFLLLIPRLYGAMSSIHPLYTSAAAFRFGFHYDAASQMLSPDASISSRRRRTIHAARFRQEKVLLFLPDFTEHPKPRKHKHKNPSPGDSNNDTVEPTPPPPSPNDDNDEITFGRDFIAGGVAGSASVIVGHPFDTMKVRLQTSTTAVSLRQSIRDFGGVASLFRGMGAPLGAAAVINAVVFGSYGFSSRLYDQWWPNVDSNNVQLTHDPWQKSFCCGAFAGFVQAFIICPLEHIKCRLQTKQNYRGPIDCLRQIVRKHGVLRLYQGWCTTLLREIPAFGLYFSTYDYVKDVTNNYLVQLWASDTELLEEVVDDAMAPRTTTHTWIASAIAGGVSGSFTWAIVYPVDLIKSQVQTAALTTPYSELRMLPLARAMVRRHGNIQCLFRGLSITVIRAFPVNGTIFPVYEFTLKQMPLLGL